MQEHHAGTNLAPEKLVLKAQLRRAMHPWRYLLRKHHEFQKRHLRQATPPTPWQFCQFAWCLALGGRQLQYLDQEDQKKGETDNVTNKYSQLPGLSLPLCEQTIKAASLFSNNLEGDASLGATNLAEVGTPLLPP